MPSTLPLLDVATFETVDAFAAPPGTLLLKHAASPAGPFLRVYDPREDRQRNYAMSLDAQERDPFRPMVVTGGADRYLSVTEWSLLVDPNSSYTAANGSWQPGDAFMRNGRGGFVATWGVAESCIATNGESLGGVNGDGFVGFTAWAIAIPSGEPGQPHLILKHSR